MQREIYIYIYIYRKRERDRENLYINELGKYI